MEPVAVIISVIAVTAGVIALVYGAFQHGKFTQHSAHLETMLRIAGERIAELERCQKLGVSDRLAAGLETAALEALTQNMRSRRLTQAVQDQLRSLDEETDDLRRLLASMRANPNGFDPDMTNTEYHEATYQTERAK